MDKTLKIILTTIILFNFISCQTIKPINKTERNLAYLFTYFTSGEKGEAIRYAISKDGFKYYALNNNEPIIASEKISTTGGVRDPHILRKNDNSGFYMVVTDLRAQNGWYNTAMVLMKSDDLINWTTTGINIPDTYPEFSEVNRVWAPQTIYDEAKGKYMVYFSMLEPDSYDKIYYAYVNDDFTALQEAPRQLFFNPGEKATIDGDIVKKDNKFYLFYKTEGLSDKGIKVAISNSLTSGYKPEEGNVDQTDKKVEGSGVFKLIDSDDYILMYDVYTNREYQFTRSSDLKEFEVVDEQVSMNFHPRHGSIIQITQAELQRLLEEFPSRDIPSNVTASDPAN